MIPPNEDRDRLQDAADKVVTLDDYEGDLMAAAKDRLSEIRRVFSSYELNLHCCHDTEAMIDFAELARLIKESA